MESLKFVVGIRQVKRALLKKQVEYIWLAEDSNYNVIKEIVELCGIENVEIKKVNHMNQLGKMFEIDVKTTSVAILKQ